MNRVIRIISTPPFLLPASLIAWELLVRLLQTPAYLIPPPSAILLLFCKEWQSIASHLVTTAVEAGAGFLLGSVVAFILATAMFRYDLLNKALMPYCAGFQAVPIVAVAPLLIIWFGSGMLSKVVMAAVISFFPTLAVILAAFEEVNPEAKLLFRLYHANYRTTLLRLLLPASLPAIVTGLKVSAGLAVVGAIVAEMTGADRGLGYMILTSSYRLETVRLFAAIITASLLGLLAYGLPGLLRLLLPHYWVQSRREQG